MTIRFVPAAAIVVIELAFCPGFARAGVVAGTARGTVTSVSMNAPVGVAMTDTVFVEFSFDAALAGGDLIPGDATESSFQFGADGLTVRVQIGTLVWEGTTAAGGTGNVTGSMLVRDGFPASGPLEDSLRLQLQGPNPSDFTSFPESPAAPGGDPFLNFEISDLTPPFDFLSSDQLPSRTTLDLSQVTQGSGIIGIGPDANSAALYAIVFEIEPESLSLVPEPASLLVWTVMVACFLGVAKTRRLKRD